MSICTCWVDAGSRGRQAERIDDAAAVPGGTSSTRYPELCTTAYPVQCGLGCRRSHVYPDTSYRAPGTGYWSSLLPLINFRSLLAEQQCLCSISSTQTSTPPPSPWPTPPTPPSPPS